MMTDYSIIQDFDEEVILQFPGKEMLPMSTARDQNVAASELYRLFEILNENQQKLLSQFQLHTNQTIELQTEVRALKADLEPLAHSIIGNGGPGMLTRVAILEKENKDMKEDIKEAKSKRWQVLTIGLVGMINLIVGLLLVFFKK